MHVRLRFFLTEDIGLSQNLLILIHMNYQARKRSITFTLTRHIDQRLEEAFMSNLVDVGIRPSNIFRVVNAMNHGEGCEEVSPQQVIDFTHHCRNNNAHEFISIIKYF